MDSREAKRADWLLGMRDIVNKVSLTTEMTLALSDMSLPPYSDNLEEEEKGKGKGKKEKVS